MSSSSGAERKWRASGGRQARVVGVKHEWRVLSMRRVPRVTNRGRATCRREYSRGGVDFELEVDVQMNMLQEGCTGRTEGLSELKEGYGDDLHCMVRFGVV